MSTDIHNNRRTNPDGMKGHTDVTSGTENEKGGMGALIGRRKFFALGGAGAARAGRNGRRGKSTDHGGRRQPVATQPRTPLASTRRSRDRRRGGSSIVTAAPGGVRHFALAGTDGWVSMPSRPTPDGRYQPGRSRRSIRTSRIRWPTRPTRRPTPSASAT